MIFIHSECAIWMEFDCTHKCAFKWYDDLFMSDWPAVCVYITGFAYKICYRHGIRYDLDIFQICFQAITKVKSDWPSSTFRKLLNGTPKLGVCSYWYCCHNRSDKRFFGAFKSIAEFNMCHPTYTSGGIVEFGCEQMALASIQMSNIKWYDEHGAVFVTLFFSSFGLTEVQK